MSGTLSSVAVSLPELLSSGVLATSSFQLKNDVPLNVASPILNGDSLRILNAAKISLVIARAVEAFKRTHALSDVMSLFQPEGFMILLGYSLPHAPRGATKVPPVTEDLEPLSFLEGPEDGDASLKFISEFFDLDKPLPSQSQQQSASSRACSGNNLIQNIGTSNRTTTLYDVVSAAEFDNVLTILNVESTPVNDGKISTKTDEQMLGDLMYYIFTGCKLGLEITLNDVNIPNFGNGSNERAVKAKRNEAETLFAALVGDWTIPTSICRLLSDLVSRSDGGREQQYQSQMSIDDAIQDLQHMCAYPQIYLYDPGTEFYSTNLLFGQRLYGRKDELTQLLGISTKLENASTGGKAECVIVSGGAGSGKTHFVYNVSAFLSNIGWVVTSASCKRGMANRSTETVLSLFDMMVTNLLAASEGGSTRDALLCSLDSTTLKSLSVYLPSLQSLCENTDRDSSPNSQLEFSQLQLTFLLSRLIKAVLGLNRKIMLVLDNFEHVDSSALTLLSEVLTSVGQVPISRFLFVGCYRDDIDESHPLTAQLADLRRHQDISLTEIDLNKLSMDDVTDIIMTELRLPRRLVLKLAEVVHKKTSGHALFVVQLLNSLVRDSVLAYSPMKRRYDWDSAKVQNLKTEDSVASLIVSNLNSLTTDALLSLRVLSCFGMQVSLSVVKLLIGCPNIPNGGIEPHLQGLIEGGVIDAKDTVVKFTHDLIQQGVYNNIPNEEKRRLHLNIGVFLGMNVSLDQHSMVGRLEESDFNRLSFVATNNVDSQEIDNIIAIAAKQVNLVDHAHMERSQRIRFARWNMIAAAKFAQGFNYYASAYYCRNGIELLHDSLWCEDTFDLCRGLHEGAASALLFLEDSSEAQQYANALIDNLPFADSLAAQYILLRSWERMGKYEEQVARGLAILRGLNFDIPLQPTPAFIMGAMAQTAGIASKYNLKEIARLRSGKADVRKKNILLSLNSMVTGAFRSSSPFLPLITCAVVNYSLQNGVYEESALSFACLGYFKIALVGDYKEGRYWADATAQLLKKSGTTSAGNRARIMLYSFVEWWYIPMRETAAALLSINNSAVAMGDVESSIYSMLFSLRCSLYAGENLTLLLNSYCELLRAMKRYKELAKLALIDVVLLENLIGKQSNAFSIFEGTIPTEDFILADAKAKQNIASIELIHTRRFLTSFWMGDYVKADEYGKSASSLPSSKMPKLWSVYRECYRGIIAFHMYLQGEGEEWLEEGKEVLKKFEFWTTISKDVFESKLLLLQAEHSAVSCDVKKARKLFHASIMAAKDHGYIHEQGLAFERYGNFLESLVETTEASLCYKSAHLCYVQWGGLAIAKHVWNKYNLGTRNQDVHYLTTAAVTAKHCRDD